MAGLQFAPSRANKHVRQHGFRVSKTVGVYLAAVLEYLSAEMLELAGNVSRDYKNSRIKLTHLRIAINSDEELKELFARYRIQLVGAGVQSHVSEELRTLLGLNKHKKKAEAAEVAAVEAAEVKEEKPKAKGKAEKSAKVEEKPAKSEKTKTKSEKAEKSPKVEKADKPVKAKPKVAA